jgi:tetratricopeptide (TPR) repeat protein
MNYWPALIKGGVNVSGESFLTLPGEPGQRTGAAEMAVRRGLILLHRWGMRRVMGLLKLGLLFLFATAARAQTNAALEQAKRAFDAQNYEEAARLFIAARADKPACEISFYLGMARYRLHQTDAALIAFEEAAKCDPKLTVAYIALGEAYVERGNDGEALGAYEAALRLEPSNVAALRGTASIFIRNKADAKAAAALENLLKKSPRDAQAHADLGAEYFAIGNQEGAEKEFQLALRLDPKSAAALLGQSNLLVRNGDERRAIEVLRRVVALAPAAPAPHFVLGSAYNRLGQFAEAAAELEAAARLGGTEPEIFYHLARAYGGLGRTAERATALAKFAELGRKATTDTETRRTALRLVDEAKSLVGSGDLAGALTRMERARDLRPQEESILFRLASLEYDLAHYDKARDAIQEAIALAPSQWLDHFLLGLIEGRSGRLPESRASLELAVKLNPAAADAREALAEVVRRQGEAR